MSRSKFIIIITWSARGLRGLVVAVYGIIIIIVIIIILYRMGAQVSVVLQNNNNNNKLKRMSGLGYPRRLPIVNGMESE